VLFRLTDHELDEATRTLRGAAGSLHVEPQVFDVLVYLVTHRDRAVPKSELLQQIWGDEFVSESALTSRVKSARAVLGDTGREQRHIRTVHGFGYQFVSPVEVRDAGGGSGWSGLARDDLVSAGLGSADRSTAALRALPVFHSPFRGRDRERARLSELLTTHRLVTMLGSGGIGKTRLAVEVLSNPLPAVDDLGLPTAFVDFAATREPGAIPDTVALTLGIEIGQRADPTAAVCEFLAAVPHIVVFDNCEHVLSAAADVASAILGATTGTRLFATSRMPLGIGGECLYRLGPLPVVEVGASTNPDALRDNPAAAIFLDRASLVDDAVMVSSADAVHVAQVCRALEGVPLALELAAGRVSAFGLADLVGLLDRQLDVLGDRSSWREERHRTLRATVEWSYDLLDEPAQRLLRVLSVFPGGVTIGCIDSIATRLGLGRGGIETAGLLVDASLITRERAGSGTRYSQLETLRTFGLEQLAEHGERAEADALLVASVLDTAARVDRGLRTPREAHWAALVREEFANIRSAHRHLADHGPVDELVTLLCNLSDWARLRDADEFWAWSDDLVELVPPGHPGRPAALAVHAQAAWRRGDITHAITDAIAAIESSDDQWVQAHARAELGAARLFIGEPDSAVEEWTRSARLDPHFFALGSAALATAAAGRTGEALDMVRAARDLVPASASADAWFSYCEGESANMAGEPDATLLDRSIASATSVDASFLVGVAMVTLASIHAAKGHRALAAARYEELVRHWVRLGSWTQQWTTLRIIAALIEEDHPETAIDILRGADADPLSAPVLVGATADEAAALRARLLERVADGDRRPLRPRLLVAEAARTALLAVADEDAAPSRPAGSESHGADTS